MLSNSCPAIFPCVPLHTFFLFKVVFVNLRPKHCETNYHFFLFFFLSSLFLYESSTAVDSSPAKQAVLGPRQNNLVRLK